MKKTILFTALAFLLFNSPTNAKNKIDNSLNLMEFNYLSEVDFNGKIEKEWVEEQEVFVYLISMKNSTDKLLAIQKKGEKKLKPILFISIENDYHSFKDINNRKKVLEINFKDEENIKIDYFEKNDSKSGLALTDGDKCLGKSSVAECYSFAVSSCNSDTVCRLMCIATGWRCHAAILAGCVVACANMDEETESTID